MKITFFACVLLFALISQQPLLQSAEALPEQVVDTSGKKLRPGSNYYIIPASSRIGGLGLTSTSKEYCPLDVVAVRGFRGLPLVFKPLDTKKGVVRVNSDLNIYFATETSCPQSTVLSVDHYDPPSQLWFVTTGGVLGNPSSDTLSYWFKIEKYEEAYKLVFCPSVCPNCSYQCRDIGIHEDQYGKRLALNDVPYKIRFEKA